MTSNDFNSVMKEFPPRASIFFFLIFPFAYGLNQNSLKRTILLKDLMTKTVIQWFQQY